MDKTDSPTGSPAPDARAVFPPRTERQIKLSWLALLWEDIWPRLWPAWGFVALYLSAGLFGAFAAVPAWAHVLIFAAVAVATGASLWISFQGAAWPSRDAALRRLDLSVEMARRAAAAYDDRLASDPDDAFSLSVWAAHRSRLYRQLAALRARWPRSFLAERDPYALRAGALIVLAIAFAAAGSDWRGRLAAAFAPDMRAQTLITAKLDAWATPPEYTGEAPIFLADSANSPALPIGGAATVPAETVLHIRVQGGGGAPRVSLSGDEAATTTEGEDVYSVTLPVGEGGDLRVSIGGARLATWTISVKPDIAPAVEFTSTPSPTAQMATRFAFTGGDDYGVVGALARLTLAPVAGETLPGDTPPLEIPLTVPGAPARSFETEGVADLTAHAWAGLAVRAEIVVTDQSGQTGLSATETFVLPARTFTHPLAKALIEQRRALAPKSADVTRAVRFLDAFTAAPESYFEDGGIYLGIRSARHRLVHARERVDIDGAMQMLWDIAVRLEDGGLSEAAERLRQVQDELQQALQGGASDDEIQRLMAELRQAMDAYMQQLTQNATRLNAPPPPGAPSVTADDLQKLMDAIQELSEQGSRELAQQLLSQLQQMLENLQAAGPMELTPEQRRTNEAIGKLGELIEKQRALMDDTFQAQQQGSTQSQSDSLSSRQEGLRAELGDIIKGMGQPGEGAPPGLGRADRSMQGAGEDLGAGRMGSAVDQQKDALEQLQESAGQLSEQLMQQLRPGGIGLGQPGSTAQGHDPLGRRQGQGGFDGQAVKIPEQMDIQRARAILEELRRRAAERGRPQHELEYLDRLLRRF